MTPVWFKWWIGSVDDPKLRLVAMKSGEPTGNVIAVWASILERCSRGDVRGECNDIECDEIACQLGYESESVASIIDEMRHRSLLDGNKVVAWSKRQETKEDRTNSERQRRHRERQQQDSNGDVTEVTPLRNAITPLRNTDEIRVDEKRVEEDTVPAKPKRTPPKFADDAEWIASLKTNDAYRGIDIDIELGKAQAWISCHPGRKLTQSFFVRWLNKADRSMSLDLESEKAAKFQAMTPEQQERFKQLERYVD